MTKFLWTFRWTDEVEVEGVIVRVYADDLNQACLLASGKIHVVKEDLKLIACDEIIVLDYSDKMDNLTNTVKDACDECDESQDKPFECANYVKGFTNTDHKETCANCAYGKGAVIYCELAGGKPCTMYLGIEHPPFSKMIS